MEEIRIHSRARIHTRWRREERREKGEKGERKEEREGREKRDDGGQKKKRKD